MEITATMVKICALTGAGVLDCRKALEKAEGDVAKAAQMLREKGLAAAAKKADRATKEGLVGHYIHTGSKVASLIEVNCESDFVARTDEFQNLIKELALQIAAASPKYISEADIPEEVIAEETARITERVRAEGKPEAIIPKIVDGFMKKFKDETVLLNQKYIRDESRTVTDLINDRVAALGERIVVRRFVRWALGETTQQPADEEEAA